MMNDDNGYDDDSDNVFATAIETDNYYEPFTTTENSENKQNDGNNNTDANTVSSMDMDR